MTLLGLLLALLAGPARAQEPDPELDWATFRQEVMPRWDARAETATRRAEARDAFFAGENSFTDAFPSLVQARLNDPAVVRARLLAVQDAASAREAERQEPLPDLGEAPRVEQARTARDAALAAEERADSLLRRYLTGVDAHLQRHPELTDAALEPTLEALHERVKDAEERVDDPSKREALLRAAAEADEELVAFATLQRELTLHAVAGRPLPSAERDEQRVTQVQKAEMAAVRLGLLRPWLDTEGQARVDAALVAYHQGPALEAARAGRAAAAAVLSQVGQEPLPAEVGQYEAWLAKEEAELEQLTAEVDALAEDAPTREARLLDLAAQKDAVTAAQIRLRRARGLQDGKLDQATAAAERARKQADEAAATAADEQQRARARFLSQAADARDRVREAAARLDGRRVELQTTVDTLEAQRVEFQSALEEIANATLLGSGTNADETYRRVRTQRTGLIDGDIARGEVVYRAKEAIAEVRALGETERTNIDRALTGLESDDAVTTAAQDWRLALDEELATAEDLLALAYDERQAVLTALQDISEIRRELRRYISWRERESDQRQLGSDIERELRLLGPTIIARLSNRLDELSAVPGRLLRDATLLLDVLWGLFWTVVLLGGWSWARGKSPDIAFRLALQVKRFRPEMRPIDIQRLKGPATVAVRATIDLTLGYLMVSRISPLSPEIAFLVEAWLLLAIYRALISVFDLAVVRAPEFRPSLIALGAEVYDLLRQTARFFIIWGIARGFAYYVLWSMLQLDTVTGIVMTLFTFVFLGLATYLLYQWDPLLRERVRSRNQESQLVAYLSREVPAFLRPVSALAMLTFFLVTVGVDFLYYLLARDRTGLARVFNVITRYQMTDEADTSVVPIPDEAIEKLTSREARPDLYVTRKEVEDALGEAFTVWRKEGRRGMVALVGDRGEGKRTEIARFVARLSKEEMRIERHRMTEMLVSEPEILAWLAEITGAEPADDIDALVDNIREVEPAMFVVEQAHRAFSRSVGGFSGISCLLYVLNATADHHFWLVSFHEPAWHYLCAIPSIVDVGVFRHVVVLDPFDGPMLRDLTQRRSRFAGLELDYRGLMRANVLGADPKVEQERAINAFYRLLAEASEGNPRVAMHQFAACLQPGERAGAARVLTRAALRTEVASELSVDALFTLTALRQQDVMALDDLVGITNLPVHTVRNTVRDLQSRALVEFANGQVYIPIHQLPLVTRTLRRRHLLHLGA